MLNIDTTISYYLSIHESPSIHVICIKTYQHVHVQFRRPEQLIHELASSIKALFHYCAQSVLRACWCNILFQSYQSLLVFIYNNCALHLVFNNHNNKTIGFKTSHIYRKKLSASELRVQSINIVWLTQSLTCVLLSPLESCFNKNTMKHHLNKGVKPYSQEENWTYMAIPVCCSKVCVNIAWPMKWLCLSECKFFNQYGILLSSANTSLTPLWNEDSQPLKWTNTMVKKNGRPRAFLTANNIKMASNI